jgi:hypothetical protein
MYKDCVQIGSPSGWWLSHPSEKYEFVSWDDDIPNIVYGKIKNVPNHQPAINNCHGKLQVPLGDKAATSTAPRK